MTTVSGLNILFVKYSVELHVKHSLELSIQLQLVDGVPDRFFFHIFTYEIKSNTIWSGLICILVSHNYICQLACLCNWSYLCFFCLCAELLQK